VPAHVEAAVRAFAYRREVFIAPPWRDIYRTDDERTQSWAEAVRTYESVRETYMRYGYRPVELPRATVAERADFLLARVIR
jgi:predicted ATPase